MQGKALVWAVDIFEDADHTRAFPLLGAVSRSCNATITPVFVLSSASTGLAITPFGEYEQSLRALAEKRFAELERRAPDLAFNPPVILANPDGTTKRDVETLIEFAKSRDPYAIVVSTHARRGLPRFILGSFAETLVLRSPIPVMTVNPQAQMRERISKILFPTTFTSLYRNAFEQVLVFAKSLDAEVVLYYKEPFIADGFRTPELYAYLEREAAERQANAREWQNYARQKGVAASLLIDNKPGYLDDAICTTASTNKIDLVAMASLADPVSAFLIGSTTRQVLRQAACPVWAVRIRD